MVYTRDHEYILTNYRYASRLRLYTVLNPYSQASYSFQNSIESIWRIHHETINIWTHLLGSILYCLVPLYGYTELRSRYNEASELDFAALTIFFFGVTTCFALSTFFHMFMNHSKEVWKLGNELDHLGIVLVIWSSMVPSDYFGFYCSPDLQILYCAIAKISALGCGIFTMKPQFRAPAY
ncbi:hypothetical protein JMJ35_008715 [Cladonia borealis]|uniref:Uncharacterized protein n=1 Tax=Cladonia borealis TaxID=184061 RepID=A0AA39V2B9_9LECA|nr:hypothetical protein JMJ35_008715 [Cladonia borealis]